MRKKKKTGKYRPKRRIWSKLPNFTKNPESDWKDTKDEKGKAIKNAKKAQNVAKSKWVELERCSSGRDSSCEKQRTVKGRCPQHHTRPHEEAASLATPLGGPAWPCDKSPQDSKKGGIQSKAGIFLGLQTFRDSVRSQTKWGDCAGEK